MSVLRLITTTHRPMLVPRVPAPHSLPADQVWRPGDWAICTAAPWTGHCTGPAVGDLIRVWDVIDFSDMPALTFSAFTWRDRAFYAVHFRKARADEIAAMPWVLG